MTINFDRPSPGLCVALREFYHARMEFRRLASADGCPMKDLDRASDRISRAEDAIFNEIERMRGPDTDDRG